MFARAAGRKPIADITFWWQRRELDDTDAARDRREVCRHLPRVGPAGVVIVGGDRNVTSSEILSELGPPFAGTARITGRLKAASAYVKNVLFALRDVDGCVARRTEQLGQHERHLPDAFHLPIPTIRCWGALPEVFRI